MGFSSVEGLLPPLYEGIKEIQTILASPELSSKLTSGDVIEKIERTETGFRITTNKRSVDVKIDYEKTQNIGPASFKLTFSEPENRKF